jgi:hypothetical protein
MPEAALKIRAVTDAECRPSPNSFRFGVLERRVEPQRHCIEYVER